MYGTSLMRSKVSTIDDYLMGSNDWIHPALRLTWIGKILHYEEVESDYSLEESGKAE